MYAVLTMFDRLGGMCTGEVSVWPNDEYGRCGTVCGVAAATALDGREAGDLVESGM